MKKTLLELAKEAELPITGQRSRTDEELELALGWLRGEITTKQANIAMGNKTSSANILYGFAVSLKELYSRGHLKVIE